MNTFTFELNNARRDADYSTGKMNQKSPVVEVFSASVFGKDYSHLGKTGEAALDYIKGLGAKALADDKSAVSEINEIRKFTIQARLMEEIKLMAIFGSYKPLAWGDTPYLETMEIHNVRADIQAEGQDVSTPFARRKKSPLAPITISAGVRANYRELSLGDFTTEAILIGEVIKQMKNKANMYVIKTVVEAVRNADDPKFFLEANGLTKSATDAFLKRVRRVGQPAITGDISILEQFTPWAGYVGNVDGTAVVGMSQKALDEIADTGILGKYNGVVLRQLENGYDYSKLNADGTDWETIYPEGLAFVTPVAPERGLSPVQTFTIGGLTSFTGNDVSTGEVLTRYDLSIAVGVANADSIGLIHDTSLDTL